MYEHIAHIIGGIIAVGFYAVLVVGPVYWWRKRERRGK